jgi:hypothetical protein
VKLIASTIYNCLVKQPTSNCTRSQNGIQDGRISPNQMLISTVSFTKFYRLVNLVCFLEVLDWKTKYDESENPFVRIVRGVTERVGHAFSKFILSFSQQLALLVYSVTQ